MFEGYSEEAKEKIRQRGGENGSLKSEVAAANNIEHGIYSSTLNYYASLSDEQQQFLSVTHDVMARASSIELDGSEDSTVEKSELRDEIIRHWRAKKLHESDLSEYDEASSKRLEAEATRQRRYALQTFRRLDLIEKGEQSIKKYYPHSLLF